MNRRQLFKMAPIAGVVIPATKLLPESVIHEVKPEKKYLIKLPPLKAEIRENIGKHLQQAGLGNITVFCGEFELYEI